MAKVKKAKFGRVRAKNRRHDIVDRVTHACTENRHKATSEMGIPTLRERWDPGHGTGALSEGGGLVSV